MSSTATTMLAMTPSIIFCRSRSRKTRNGGPALLLTRMSGSGQAARRAFWPSGEATSAATAMILAPVALRSSAAVASSCSLLRPLMTTSQPASARWCAQPRPRPLLDAQTMALRPAIPRSMAFPSVVPLGRARNRTARVLTGNGVSDHRPAPRLTISIPGANRTRSRGAHFYKNRRFAVSALLSHISVLQIALVVIVTAISAVLGGIAGYGTGPLMPLVLVPIVGAAPVVPIIAISAMFTNGARLSAFREVLNIRLAIIAFTAALPTCLLGAYLYTLLSGRGAAIVIGTTLMATVPLRRILKGR